MENETTILIVDDIPGNVDVLRKTLEVEGYSISMAPSGEVALKIAPKIKPDLILMDVMMPGMDGFETCRKLKEDTVFENTPIIFVTGKAETEDVVDAFIYYQAFQGRRGFGPGWDASKANPND